MPNVGRPKTTVISHEDAQKAAQRLVNGAFCNGREQPRFRIPAQPDDDDLLIMAYIRQQEEGK